jgi:hypothetical protein
LLMSRSPLLPLHTLIGLLCLASSPLLAGKSSYLERYEDPQAPVPRFSGGHAVESQRVQLTNERSKSGKGSVRIDCAVSEKGWGIFQTIDTLPGGVYPGSIEKGDEIRFQAAAGEGPLVVNLQVMDANGEFFLADFPLTGRGWTRCRVVLRESGFVHHWNGDGTLDFPLSQVNFTINLEEAGSVTAYIDDFELRGKNLTTEWPPEDYTAGGKYSKERVEAALALRNRAELELPVIEGKHVLAHNMASLFDEHTPDLAFLVREYFDKEGSTADLGGYLQFLPYIDYREGSPLGAKSPVEAAKMEIKAAMASGLDGFQFYYPYGPDEMMEDYTRTIRAHFEAAEELDVDFHMTLCFSNADHSEPEADKIARWARHTKALIESTPGDYWLKTPDGRHIFFTWMVDGLADEIRLAWDVQYDAALIKFAALALENLEKALGVDAAWVNFFLKLDAGMDPKFTTEMLDYFPAVWPWSQYDYRHREDNLYDDFARLAAERKRGFFYASTLDFYSSKTYPTDTWDLIFDIEQAKQLGVHGQYRHYMELELTRGFRKMLERAITMEDGIINVVTWNDYAEGHHLAPDTNHNFAFAMILNYYRNLWLDPDYVVEKEQAAVFFKKYRHDAKPVFDYELHVEGPIDPSASDFIEVVTLLKEPAEVLINGQPAGTAKAGIDAVRIPTEVGPVSFVVLRDGKEVLSLEATEWITDKPHRTDRHTYGYSTVEEDYLQLLFGDDRRSIFPSREYAQAPARDTD